MNLDAHGLPIPHKYLLNQLLESQPKNYNSIIQDWKKKHMVEYDASLQKSIVSEYKNKKSEPKFKNLWVPLMEAFLNVGLIHSKVILWKIKLPNLEKVYAIVELMQNQLQTFENFEKMFQLKTKKELNDENFQTLQQESDRELNKTSYEEKQKFTLAINKFTSLYQQLKPKLPRRRGSPALKSSRQSSGSRQDVRSSSPSYHAQLYQGKSVDYILNHIYTTNRQDDTSLIQNQVRKVIQLLETVHFKSFGPFQFIDYQLFGSQLNGFGTKSSDIDLSLLTSSYVDERKFLKKVYLQMRPSTKAIKAQAQYKFLDNARIPLIDITIDGVQVDICANNVLGVINTQLLKAYADLHPKIPQLGILLKTWGKANDVVSKARLSSYTIILMLLFFLQNKFDLPHLQNQEERQILKIKRNFTREEVEIHEFDTDVYFMQNKDDKLRQMHKAKQKLDQTPLIDILTQFWDFYSRQGYYFSEKRPIISISKEHENKKRPQEKFNSYVVVDPFDIKHDPGEKADKSLAEINQKFAEARDYALRMQDSDIWKLFISQQKK